jgi:hypothetical protein
VPASTNAANCLPIRFIIGSPGGRFASFSFQGMGRETPA